MIPKKLFLPLTVVPWADSRAHWAATTSGNLAPAAIAAASIPSQVLELYVVIVDQGVC